MAWMSVCEGVGAPMCVGGRDGVAVYAVFGSSDLIPLVTDERHGRDGVNDRGSLSGRLVWRKTTAIGRLSTALFALVDQRDEVGLSQGSSRGNMQNPSEVKLSGTDLTFTDSVTERVLVDGRHKRRKG